MDKTILLVDGDIDLLSSVKELLRTHGYFVLEHSDPREALECFRFDEGLNFVPADIDMPNADGISFLEELCATDEGTEGTGSC